MIKSSIIRSVSLLSLGSYSTLALAIDQNERPNILFILADDLGWNDLGCTGSEYYETPNIDRIAQRGVNFTNGYAACQVSSPSRASIMTGKYTPNHGITNWIGEASGEKWRNMKRSTKVLPADYKWNLAADEITLAEALQNYGYKTIIAGKWHLGEDESSWPEFHGFDVNKGGYSSGSPRGGYFSDYKNPRLADGPKGENLSMRLAKETISFIKEQKRNKTPFFAYLSFYAVHGPIQCSQTKYDYFKQKAEKMGIANEGFKVDRTQAVRQHQDNPVYAGLISHMDDAVGYVLDQLEEMGLDKNTIIIFTSDNGGVSSGDNYSTSCLPLRGGKGRQWEGGIRVPYLISHPAYSDGKSCETPVSGIDFYPTLISLIDGKMSRKQKVDGVDISPLLEAENLKERSLFWHYPHYGNQGGEPSSIVRNGDWKLIYYHEDQRVELYNLKIDKSESNHLNGQYPNKVVQLKKELSRWLATMDAKMPTPDPAYSPIDEAKFQEKRSISSLKIQEESRKKMLSKGWKPNKSWWGSQTGETID